MLNRVARVLVVALLLISAGAFALHAGPPTSQTPT